MNNTKSDSLDLDLQKSIEELFSSEIDPIYHLRELNYPRRAGTDGDKKASNYLVSKLTEFGYEPIIQEFHYKESSIISSLRFPLTILCWGLLTLLNILFFFNFWLISLITLSLPLVIVIILFRFESVMKYFSRKRWKGLEKLEESISQQKVTDKEERMILTSQNVVAEIGKKDASHQILLTAHYDTISSKLPMKFTKITGLVGFISFFLFSLLYGVNFVGEFFFDWDFMNFLTPIFVILLVTMLVLLEVLLGSRIFRGNESHGSIDDGTGVAILLELAKFFQKQDISDYRFTFGFFSAEEAGLIGSSFFHRNSKMSSDTHIISVDMIGEKAPLAYVKSVNPLIRTKLNPNFNKQIILIADHLDIEIKGINFIYPGSDFAHWLHDGYRTNWLINGSKYIHSRHDIFANVDETLVRDALKLLLGYFILELSVKPNISN
ncbi:MAG: M28 family metallopeptidase [Candidatus Hodarchaeales archaeon]